MDSAQNLQSTIDPNHPASLPLNRRRRRAKPPCPPSTILPPDSDILKNAVDPDKKKGRKLIIVKPLGVNSGPTASQTPSKAIEVETLGDPQEIEEEIDSQAMASPSNRMETLQTPFLTTLAADSSTMQSVMSQSSSSPSTSFLSSPASFSQEKPVSVTPTKKGSPGKTSPLRVTPNGSPSKHLSPEQREQVSKSLENSVSKKKRVKPQRSDVWGPGAFLKLKDGTAQCSKCKQVYSANTSTGTLKSHCLSCGIELKKALPSDDETLLNDFFVKSNCSFNMLNLPEFREILQRNIKPISADTQSRRIVKYAQTTLENLREELKDVKKISLMADSWKTMDERYVHGVIGRYYYKGDIKEVPFKIDVLHKHTKGEQIASIIQGILSPCSAQNTSGLDIKQKVQAITTDGGSDEVSGANIAGVARFWCFNHMLNTAVEKFLDCPYIAPLFGDCRLIMNYSSRADFQLPALKETEKEHYLPYHCTTKPTSIQKFSKTRWLSASNMFNSITYNLKSLETALTQKQRLDLLIAEEDFELLYLTTKFMQDLANVQLFMESENNDALTHILPAGLNTQVLVHNLMLETENQEFKNGLAFFYNAFIERMNINCSHPCLKIATILNPILKDLKYLEALKNLGIGDDEIEKTREGMLKEIKKEFDEFMKSKTPKIAVEKTPGDTQLQFNPILNYMMKEKPKSEINELDAYLEMNINKDTFTNASDWWKKQESMFPNLAEFAREYLVISGSSAPVERLWSLARDIMDEKRTSLGDETLASLIFLKGHLKNKPLQVSPTTETADKPEKKKRQKQNKQ